MVGEVGEDVLCHTSNDVGMIQSRQKLYLQLELIYCNLKVFDGVVYHYKVRGC